ncbi:MAG TPA: nucleotidyltransferase domain-containing protein [Candidatus Hydrogenedentes bacterium]|nr:nucleotidyltransferase domain-containing protein [Candidatus Hydrogenedentota bacterium]
MELPVQIDKDRIACFCQKHHIVRFAFFGSVLTERFTEESDVDVLVEFDPAHIPGMIRLCGMERELSEILGRKADMRTANDLSRYFRDEVMNSALVQYAA